MFLPRHLAAIQKCISQKHLPASCYPFITTKTLRSGTLRGFCVSSSALNSSYGKLNNNKYYSELQQLTKQHGPESLEVVDFLESKSFELHKEGLYEDALQFATTAKDIYKDIKMSASEYSLLTLISQIHVQQNNYEQAIEALNELIDLKMKVQGENDSSLGNLHARLASLYFNQTKYEESLQSYRKALQTIEEDDPKAGQRFLHLYYSAGLSAFNISNFDESNSYTLKALDYAEKTKDQKAVYRCCHLLGLLREETNNLDDGVFYFKKALFAGEEAFNPQSYEIALINYLIGKGEFRLRKTDEALKYTNKALSLFNQAKDKNPLDIADARYNLGLIYFKQKQTDLALENLDKALEEFTKFGDQYEIKIALVLENKGLILQELGRKEEALAAFDKVIALCNKYQNSQNMQVAKIYENIAKIYVEFYKEKASDARGYAQKALQIASYQKDSPFYKEVQALVDYLNKKH